MQRIKIPSNKVMKFVTDMLMQGKCVILPGPLHDFGGNDQHPQDFRVGAANSGEAGEHINWIRKDGEGFGMGGMVQASDVRIRSLEELDGFLGGTVEVMEDGSFRRIR